MSPIVTTLLILLALSSGLPPLVGVAFSGQHAVLPTVPFSAISPIQNPFRSESELAKGKFLVAGRRLGDPNFAETVVLLIGYDQDGAIGVIINHPTEVGLSTLLPEIKGLQQRKDLVYIGGPVARSQMLILVHSSSQPEESQRVLKDIYICSSRTMLQQMIDEAGAGARFRAYAGYAGWASGQLDLEVSRGDWHVLPADAATVFDKAAAEIWPELIHRSEVQWPRGQKPDQGNLLTLNRDDIQNEEKGFVAFAPPYFPPLARHLGQICCHGKPEPSSRAVSLPPTGAPAHK
ncbi:MAG: YqgE/AlgH family protein, partial [Deltaproteobacteria bacterium]|nr:YqgE/AlgH family protein [Deltaproteobacteria bacterium]